MTAYLDHAATTPMLPSALAAMTEQLAVWGNPSSLHTTGRQARRVVEESRERLARTLGARASEVVFTSGGTEANNYALQGLFFAERSRVRRPHIVTSQIEHPSILSPCRFLEELGAEVVVRRNDAITADQAAVLAPDRLVVSPGPGRPADAGVSVELIRRLGPTVPTLGVCLGHQAIVEAFGGEIGQARALLHGKASRVRHDGRGVYRGLPEEIDNVRFREIYGQDAMEVEVA